MTRSMNKPVKYTTTGPKRYVVNKASESLHDGRLGVVLKRMIYVNW